MGYVKKALCLLITMFIVVGFFNVIQIEAEEISLKAPTIKVKSVRKGKYIKVSILKTKNVDGFEIFAYGDEISYKEYKNVSDDYLKIAVVKKNGNAKRTITIKSLPAGTYKIKVRSYKSEKDGSMTYSDFSMEKTVKIKKSANGYKTSYDFSGVKKGDIIKFGAYEQDNDFTNGMEPIEWIVLDKTEKDILLISKYAIDSLPFNKDRVLTGTWQDSTSCKWLNEMFYVNAFNEVEKNKIKGTKSRKVVLRYDGEDAFIEYNTEKKVFILTTDEVTQSNYGFNENINAHDVKRRCAPTAYTIARGVHYASLTSFTDDGEQTCPWLLGSKGESYTYKNRMTHVDYDGWVDYIGAFYFLDSDSFGIRPSIYISLD